MSQATPDATTAVFVSYKLLLGHPRTTRMATALRRCGCDVTMIGLTNGTEHIETEVEPEIRYLLVPRAHARLLLNRILGAPLSFLLRVLLDDVYRDLAARVSVERRNETEYGRALPRAGMPLNVDVGHAGDPADETAEEIDESSATAFGDDFQGWRKLVVLVGGTIRRFVRRSKNAVRKVVRVIARLQMPTFPAHELNQDGELCLRWFAPFRREFVVELHNVASGEKEHVRVAGQSHCRIRVGTPGEYSWRVVARNPGSGWSRKLGFGIRPDGRILLYAGPIRAVETFFSVLWPLVPRNLIARWLGRGRTRLRQALQAGPDRFYRAIEIFLFSLRVLRVYRGQPATVLIAHDLYAVPVVRWMNLWRRVPFYYDAVELSFGRMRKTPPGPLSRRLIHVTEAQCRYARDVFAGCPYLLKDLKLRHPRLSPVQLLNGPAEIVSGKSEYLREQCGIGANERIVLYVGYLSPGRGLETFVRAAALLPAGIHCVAMGPGSEGYRGGLEALIREVGVADRFSIVDPVPETEVVSVSSSADAGISPVNRDFGNGQYVLNNKLFQYIAAGLPVLASDVEGVGGFVTEEEIGLVFDEREPESVARVITECFTDQARYQAIVSRARTVADKYSWANQERVFLHHVLGGDPAQPAMAGHSN